MIRALLAAVWLMAATFFVGYVGIGLGQWIAQEWRAARLRRQVNRRDRREIARYRAARNTTSPIDFWSHP